MKYILLSATLFVSAFCQANNPAIFNKLNTAKDPSAQSILNKIETKYANQGGI